jgi:hypothetical protein
MKYHKDEKMRGRMLKDTRNGNLWPWTETLSKLPHMELTPEVKPVVEKHTISGHKKPDFNDVLASIKSKKVKHEVKKDVEPDVDEEDDDIKGTDNPISE